MKVSNNIYAAERQIQILKILEKKGRATVSELSKLFNTSGVTIRFDLNKLSSEGQIKRTHGGAIYIGEKQKSELPFDMRKKRQQDAKTSIGKAAAELIEDGDIVFIGGSTTAVSMIPYLQNKQGVTIITNSLEIAYKLAHLTHLDIITIGGKIKRETLSLVGYSFENIIQEINIGKVFLSGAGFTIEDGLTDINHEEIVMRRKILEKTKKIIALVDSTKWGKVSLVTFVETNKINTIITDSGAPEDIVSRLNKLGVNTILAP